MPLCTPPAALCSGEDTLLGEEEDRRVGMLVQLRKKKRKGPLPTTSPASAPTMPFLYKGTALQLGVGVWTPPPKKGQESCPKTPRPHGRGLGVALQRHSKTHPRAA